MSKESVERAVAEEKYKSACAGQHMTADEYAAFDAGWDGAMALLAARERGLLAKVSAALGYEALTLAELLVVIATRRAKEREREREARRLERERWAKWIDHDPLCKEFRRLKGDDHCSTQCGLAGARLRAVEEERNGIGGLAFKQVVIDDLTQKLATAQADAQRLTDERDGLAHTLHLWNQECGGRSPREIIEQHTAQREALRVTWEAKDAEIERLTAEVEQWKVSYYPLKADLREAQQQLATQITEIERLTAEVARLIPLTWDETARVWFGELGGQYSQGTTPHEARRAIISALVLWKKVAEQSFVEQQTRERALVEALQDAMTVIERNAPSHIARTVNGRLSAALTPLPPLPPRIGDHYV